MMKRCAGTTSRDLICHARSWLLWRRCIKCGTLLTKVTTKLRVKAHMCGARIGSKRLRWFKAFIASYHCSNGVGGLLSLSSEPGGEGMVRVTHAKLEPEHFGQRGGGRIFHAAVQKTTPVHSYRSDRYDQPV
jgi:hypothetical protein